MNEQRFDIKDRLTEADKRISSSLIKLSPGLMEKLNVKSLLLASWHVQCGFC
jgi:hypothetical protein